MNTGLAARRVFVIRSACPSRSDIGRVSNWAVQAWAERWRLKTKKEQHEMSSMANLQWKGDIPICLDSIGR